MRMTVMKQVPAEPARRTGAKGAEPMIGTLRSLCRQRENGRRDRDVWVLGIGTTVTIGSAVLADRGVGPVEQAVFHAINGSSDLLGPPMYVVQLAGTMAVPALVSLVALRQRRVRQAAALLSLLPVKQVLEHDVLKVWVNRQRPAACDIGAIVRYDAAVDGLAFPSGHSVVAFGVAGLVTPCQSRRRTVTVFGLAALVGFARIYLGAHAPLDVVGGSAEGLALAAGLKLLWGCRVHGLIRHQSRWIARSPRSKAGPA